MAHSWPLLAQMAQDVFLGDAALRASAGDSVKIDVIVLGDPSNQRRRMDLFVARLTVAGRRCRLRCGTGRRLFRFGCWCRRGSAASGFNHSNTVLTCTVAPSSALNLTEYACNR